MTRVKASVVGLAAVVLALTTLASPAGARPAGPDAIVRQAGTYARLVDGGFAAAASVHDLMAGPTSIGVGTFTGLDGELVVVGGRAFRVGVDGRPQVVDATAGTPFAQVVAFGPTRRVAVPPGTACADLDPILARLGGPDAMVAVRVRGTFSALVTRSVPAQPVPYPTLTAAVAKQVVFDLGRQRAVLVGFRSGASVAGLSAPGLHLHGLTADRSAGGHVLSCVAGADVDLAIEPIRGVALALPGRAEGSSPVAAR